MPRRTAWRRISRIASTPAAWPSSSDRSRCRAQRRLPSMMIATWRGSSSGGTVKGSVGASGDTGPIGRLIRLPVDERRGVRRRRYRTGH